MKPPGHVFRGRTIQYTFKNHVSKVTSIEEKKIWGKDAFHQIYRK